MSVIFQNKHEVENFIYSSYVRAEEHIPGGLPDKETRNPILTKKLLEMLGHPDKKQRNILVTGSKGKGSASRMISKLLETHGYKVGLFTSPHLVNFNERIRINGKAISEADLVKYGNRIEPYFTEIEKTLPINTYIGPVGTTAVIAALYFLDNKTDFNVIECGKGARYDDVSMVHSELSVINSVFLEHIPQLGNNLAEIAFNKAGVIKETQRYVFTAKQQAPVFNVIKTAAEELGVGVKCYETDFVSENIRITSKGTQFDIKTEKGEYKDIQLLLLGRHQAQNAALAVNVAENLIGDLDIGAVRECFGTLTWPGRLEIINHSPLTVLDSCISSESAAYVSEVLHEMQGSVKDSVVFITGIPDDKNYAGVLHTFKEMADKIIVTKSLNPHLKFTEAQYINASEILGEKYIFEENIGLAIEKAYEILGNKGMLVILGTISLIRETKEYFNQDTTDL